MVEGGLGDWAATIVSHHIRARGISLPASPLLTPLLLSLSLFVVRFAFISKLIAHLSLNCWNGVSISICSKKL